MYFFIFFIFLNMVSYVAATAKYYNRGRVHQSASDIKFLHFSVLVLSIVTLCRVHMTKLYGQHRVTMV